PAISTDIIAGFPGETEEEFAATAEFVKGIHFSRTHIFKYSVRQGTVAAKMDGQVPESVKKERAGELARIDRAAREAYAEKFIGKELSVLFEEPAMRGGKRIMKGYSREYIPVFCETERDLSGVIQPVLAVKCDKEGEISASLSL
ncbi:MAG: tRNA (N(6)-L-threonylcarbamoyladenosine(37)-C(2))-methylthiotransferase MtaB, partial [Lachnospiraceae bacterium]|nr:tRNA (N(6)-L-threonylcarbamoyladenosine(37)-C(2))-methylthiotransferase MtaB [Lachnospiraceae bacterium]